MRLRLSYLIFLFAFLPALAIASPAKTIEISITKGDYLINICKRYLEDPNKWRTIARINSLRNPDLIYPGQKLIVPVDLLRGVPFDGLVTFVKGFADLYIKESGEWKEIHLNDRIGQGSRIKTGDESTIEITFEDDVSLLLRSNTFLDLASIQKKGALHRLYIFFLDIGRTISKVRQITGKEPRFEIHTPSAVAAVRGTEFRASVDAKATKRYEVLKGTVGVEGRKHVVEVREGEGTVIRKDAPPIEPKKLLPPPKVVNLKPLYKGMPLEFSFEKIEGAFSYRLMLARDKTFKGVIKEKVIKPDEKLKIVGIEDGSYFLQSRTIDGIGLEGPASEAFVVNVRVNPLPPFIQSPVDGAEYRERTVQFRWLRVPDAVKYHIQVAQDPEFNVITEERRDGTGSKYKTGVLDFGTSYFRARSIAKDDYEGIWSDILSFEIIPPPPSPPVEKPEMGKEKIHIRWRNLGENIKYHFQMAKDETFNEIIIDSVLDSSEVTLQKPQEAGSFYVRSSAIDSEGYEGSFSTPQSFEIKEEFPYLLFGGGILTTLLLLLLL